MHEETKMTLCSAQTIIPFFVYLALMRSRHMSFKMRNTMGNCNQSYAADSTQDNRSFPRILGNTKDSSRRGESCELVRSRREFVHNMARLRKLEQSSILDYINSRVRSCSRELRAPAVRVMSVDQKDKLLGFLRKKSPELRKLNLSDLTRNRELLELNDSPSGCYVTETKIKYKSRAMFNRSSYLWELCQRAPLNESQRLRILRLGKVPTKVTTYRLTKKFIEKNCDETPHEEYTEAAELTKKKPELPPSSLVTEYRYHAAMALVPISPLPAVCGRVFCFGHRAILFPCAGPHVLAVLDLSIFVMLIRSRS